MGEPSSPSLTVLLGSEFPRAPTSTELYAVWKLLRSECARQHERFYACKAESPDPAHCVQQGLDCTKCAKNIFRAIEQSPCSSLFDAHVYCYTAKDNMFGQCNKTEEAFLKCFENDGRMFLKKDY